MTKLAILISTALIAFVPNPKVRRDTPVTIVGVDYSFQSSDTLSAGPVVFTLKNQGAMHHQLTVLLLKKGRTLDDYLRTTPVDRFAMSDETFGGVGAIAGRTSAGRLGADLLSGRTYLLVCNDRDAADKPPHVQLGMVKMVFVR